jgi:hypothetical protein
MEFKKAHIPESSASSGRVSPATASIDADALPPSKKFADGAEGLVAEVK